ncbi:leucine-rich repeat domain-containing protein [Alkalinema pantanalense CENA528]|uniref:leucine-rich repeat domain-containing protein n=1 Tax=Alkalinema pantanalense TaxID=1620705 RepID=UPI003D6FB4BF
MRRDELLAVIEEAKRSGQTSLHLSSQDIQELPPEIGQLSNLTSLYLIDNRLITLPESIGQLNSLTSLYLSYNQLTILPESIGELSELTSLHLDHNQLTTLPESIGELSELTCLDLNSSQLTVLPKSIGKLVNLTSLFLSFNKLTTLPESIGQLINLTSLLLSFNKITALPESVGQLSNLTSLNLSGNRLMSLPESIGQLNNLTSLHLSSNRLMSLPESIWQLTNLISLDLSANKLIVLPESIDQLNQLKELDLNANKIQDLPLELTHLNQLKKLDIRNNNLGQLPLEVRRKYTQPEPVFNFLRQLKAEKSNKIYEAKLSIIGEDQVSKPSLENHLVNSQHFLKFDNHLNILQAISQGHSSTAALAKELSLPPTLIIHLLEELSEAGFIKAALAYRSGHREIVESFLTNKGRVVVDAPEHFLKSSTSLQNSPQIWTGDYVAGDKIGNDKVMGDKIVNIQPNSYPQAADHAQPSVLPYPTAPSPSITSPNMNSPLKIFVSYSHEDAEWLKKLQIHLKPLTRKGTIDLWDDTRIQTGDNWLQEIETALANAQIAILLVSPNFIASDFIADNELPPLLDAAQANGLKIFWIPISYSSHTEMDFNKYQAAHNPKQPLASLPPVEQDRVLVKICQDIKRLTT